MGARLLVALVAAALLCSHAVAVTVKLPLDRRLVAGESHSQTFAFNFVVSATVSTVAGQGSTARTALCVSQGFAPSSDVASWDGAGCATMGSKDQYSTASGITFAPVAGPWYLSVAVLSGVLTDTSYLTVESANCTASEFEDYTTGNCVPFKALNAAFGTVSTALTPQDRAPGTHTYAIALNTDLASKLAFVIVAGKDTNVTLSVRWNGAPLASGQDCVSFGSPAGPCHLSMPRAGIIFVTWTNVEELPSGAEWSVTVYSCVPGALDASCGTRLVYSQAAPGTAEVGRVSFGGAFSNETVLFSFMGGRNFSFGIYYANATLSKPAFYVSHSGFPNKVFGEEYTVYELLSSHTMRVTFDAVSPLASGGDAARVYIRVDQRVVNDLTATAEYTWFTNTRCPGSCASCNATTALCECDAAASGLDPATCAAPPNVWQWYVVAAAVGFIVVTVLVAWIVRCCRNRRSSKYVEIN